MQFINGQVLHRSDVQLALRSAPQEAQQAPIEKVYPQLLSSMVNGLLLAQAARKAKIDADPLVKEQIALAQNEILADAYVVSLQRAQITEAKLRELYDQYAKNAPTEEEVSARHILVPTEQEAKDMIEQLKKGADFATLAKEKTTDPSGKASGGDLGYFTKKDMVPEFADAAFALKKGEFTQTPVHTQFGWHVIKVEDRRPGKAGPYEQIAPQIAQQLTQQIVGQKLQELRSQGKIEVFDLNGKPLAMATPGQAAPQAAQGQQPAAPTLALPGGQPDGGGARMRRRSRPPPRPTSFSTKPRISTDAMADNVSPLAPESFPALPPIAGVTLATAHCGIRYKGRTDLMVALLDPGTAVAGVFTRSLTPGAPVDWCRRALKKGKARAIIVNSGIANVFTGRQGQRVVEETAKSAARLLDCDPREIYVSSTGVIGEALPGEKIIAALPDAVATASPSAWSDAARRS